MINTILNAETFKLPLFARWHKKIETMLLSNWAIGLLIILGIARVLLFAFAYPPADGADAVDYYAFAAYLAGFDIPFIAADVPLVFPAVIWFFYYVMGNFWLILVFQWVLSSLLGVLIFLALRRYDAFLALLVALAITFDAQVGVLYNFTSTEPIYIFVLVLIFYLTQVHQKPNADEKQTGWFLWGDVALAFCLVLAPYIRTVPTYLYVPIIFVFILGTRDWKRILTVLGSFIGFYFAFQLIVSVLIPVYGMEVNDRMLNRPVQALTQGDSLETPEALTIDCNTLPDDEIESCIRDLNEATQQAINNAFLDVLTTQTMPYLTRFTEQFFDYLRMSGQQYGGLPTPATVTCEDVDARAIRNADMMINTDWQAIELTPNQAEVYYALSQDFSEKMCPPTLQIALAHTITDTLAERYRSLSRPRPLLWYGGLLVLIFVMGSVRSLWYPTFVAGSIVVYHAAVSAAIFNVQPRYVVVTNPFRAYLVVATLYILLKLILMIIDRLVSRRQL